MTRDEIKQKIEQMLIRMFVMCFYVSRLGAILPLSVHFSDLIVSCGYTVYLMKVGSVLDSQPRLLGFFVVSLSHAILFFFFQAEDGIRDLVRSRGLGDVYKRQFVETRFLGPQQVAA